MTKIYRVQMNSKGMPDFSTAVEIENIPIYGNEHNCIMTIFGKCSYAETGCGDCAVVEKVRKALSADRPQGEWIEQEACWQCSECGDEYVLEVGVKPIDARMHYCPNCGARMLAKDTNGNVKLCGKCMSELLMWLDADDFCADGEREGE